LTQFPSQQSLRQDVGLSEGQVKQLMSVAGDHTATEAEWVQACLLLGDRQPQVLKKRRNRRLALILGSVVLMSAGGLWYGMNQPVEAPVNSGLDQSGTGTYQPIPGTQGVPGYGEPVASVPANTVAVPIGTVDYNQFMSRMQRKIKRNWRPARSDVSRHVTVSFKVHRNGEMSDLGVKNSSSVDTADAAAIKAVEAAAPFDHLPAGGEDVVDILFTFDYNVFQK
jgi:TonB family protein